MVISLYFANGRICTGSITNCEIYSVLHCLDVVSSITGCFQHPSMFYRWSPHWLLFSRHCEARCFSVIASLRQRRRGFFCRDCVMTRDVRRDSGSLYKACHRRQWLVMSWRLPWFRATFSHRYFSPFFSTLGWRKFWVLYLLVQPPIGATYILYFSFCRDCLCYYLSNPLLPMLRSIGGGSLCFDLYLVFLQWHPTCGISCMVSRPTSVFIHAIFCCLMFRLVSERSFQTKTFFLSPPPFFFTPPGKDLCLVGYFPLCEH